MKTVRKIAAVLAFAAAVLTAAGQAHADDDNQELDDTEQAICIADRLGQTPAQIAAGINAGDPRINIPNARIQTWFLIATGGCN